MLFLCVGSCFTNPNSAGSDCAHCFTQNLFSHLTEVVIFPVLVLVFAEGVLSKYFKEGKLTDRFKDIESEIEDIDVDIRLDSGLCDAHESVGLFVQMCPQAFFNVGYESNA